MNDIVERLEKWKELAKRDDWHLHFVGSDIREMIAEIERLKRFLEIALDAYEDANDELVNKDPNIGKPGHFVTEARAALNRRT